MNESEAAALKHLSRSRWKHLRSRMLLFGVYSRINTRTHSEIHRSSSRRLSLCLWEKTKGMILGYCTENRSVHQPTTSTGSTSVHSTKIHLKKRKKTFTAKGAEPWKGQREGLKTRHAGKRQSLWLFPPEFRLLHTSSSPPTVPRSSLENLVAFLCFGLWQISHYTKN